MSFRLVQVDVLRRKYKQNLILYKLTPDEIAKDMNDVLEKYLILERALRTIHGGILPDGDHVNLPTQVYAEEVLNGSREP